ncbi:NAD(P)H-hydrate dehydratase [Planosporangium sp. 12N6]|uniref:NAD(P)H-hydrate dehydratase n=1 Tax=Planosporangium spinosum TaxID=3402278 RepID=UPI003CED2734
MRPAWRVASVRAAEEALMATLPAGTLMRRAAAGLARRCGVLLRDRYGSGYGRRVLLLVGAGNNGGDALYAGADLARRGVAVSALLLNPERAHAGGLAALTAAGGRTCDAVPATVDLVVDGILGIGGRGALREDAADLVARATAARGTDGDRPTVVAVDLPSGVDADTGAVPGAAVTADVTVTFGVLKPGLLIGAGAVHSGLVDLVDIGLGPWLTDEPAVRMPDLEDVAGWWPQPRPGDDKYTRGVIGVATGSATYPGAALLSTAGALAGPAGMVRYAGAAVDAVRDRYPSVIPTGRVADAGRVQAWTCGCGLGTDDRAAGELRAVLDAPVPACLDADALTLLAGSGVDVLRGRSAPVVVTPHDREFARLAGAEPGDDRVTAALRFAARTGVVVLLKGDRTIVGTPDGRAYVNPTGTPALATAGTGDVLAGLLGALLAAGLPPERAAVAAAYAHGLAGRYAAESGPVTSADVAEALRPALARAGMWRSDRP